MSPAAAGICLQVVVLCRWQNILDFSLIREWDSLIEHGFCHWQSAIGVFCQGDALPVQFKGILFMSLCWFWESVFKVLPVEMFFLLTCFYLLKCFCLCFCWTFKAKPDPKIPLKNGSSESGADRDWCRDSRLPCLIIIKHRDIVYYNCNYIILIQRYIYRWKCEEGDGKNYKNISLTFNVENINIDNIMLFNRSISFNNII